jgi:hypothetical protein
MKKSSHSKIKNTIILFELLTRQVAADTMKGVDNSPALNLIKNFFASNKPLAKELMLYQTLVNENYKQANKANFLINTVIGLRKKINAEQLKAQKYELIREIKKHYNLENFFNTKMNDYKLYASIYRIFEGVNITTAAENVDSRFTVVEHLTRTNKPMIQEQATIVIEEYKKQDEEVRMLAYKLMVDKFNDKYATLSAKQKRILKEYINNVSNSSTLRDRMIKEAVSLRLELEKEQKKVADKVTKIKLTEAINLTKKFEKIKTVKEDNVLALLLYHELLKELKNAHK